MRKAVCAHLLDVGLHASFEQLLLLALGHSECSLTAKGEKEVRFE